MNWRIAMVAALIAAELLYLRWKHNLQAEREAAQPMEYYHAR